MTMESLYRAAGITRQSFHEWMTPTKRQLQTTPEDMVLELARTIRGNYLPGSSAREVYFFIRKHKNYSTMLSGWGKHTFENLCLSNGLRIMSARFKPKTTIRGAYIFPNKIAGIHIDDINKILVSDISYIFNLSGQLVGYATSLIDLYSRRLLGLNFSKTMTAKDTSLAVIKQALAVRGNIEFKNTIFHSDGGKQYIAKKFIQLLRNRNIDSSMAENCYENPHAESFNNTLKNRILADLNINSFTQLKRKQKFIVNCFNHYKVHTGINRFTPVEYELYIKNLKPCQRTKLKIIEIL